QSTPRLGADGAGGAIVAWRDTRNGTANIYAERLNPSGARQWIDDVRLSAAATAASNPQLTSDGAGGAIAVWQAGSGTTDIAAQRVSAAGSPLWGASGVAVCTAADNQSAAQLISDGASGAIVTWEDLR